MSREEGLGIRSDLEMDIKLQFIQELISLRLIYVGNILTEEVRVLAGENPFFSSGFLSFRDSSLNSLGDERSEVSKDAW